ncbi:MAG TPA: GNAT family N-acetyltransferase [Bryobacteraceae bacterium]|jgi:aminoglycoside 6'-N-acetyltransferase|nr:GNAT family N-acetyltransferase [Bryobacteraceae bacterium]
MIFSTVLLVFEDRPIGYLKFYPQFYPITGEERAGSIFAIDQFIGEVSLWNRGIGTRAVRLLLRYLFRVKHASKVILDPHAGNKRAIRCYEKCGFARSGCWRSTSFMRVNAGTVG